MTTRPGTRSASDELYAKMSVAAVVFALVFEAGYFLTSSPPYDGLGYLIGRDFLSTWIGARGVLAGGPPEQWFDVHAFNAAIRQVFGPDFPYHNWSYPPHLLLFVWPLGYLPYLPAFAIWCIIGFALYMASVAQGERRVDRLLMFAAAPAVVVNVFSGQNGFFTAALLIGGLRLLDQKPIVSGILFGLLTIKPQLGFLLPLFLVLTGRWICIASAAVTTLGLALVAALVFGPEVWSSYVELALPVSKAILSHGSGILPSMVPTVFMNARIAGLPLDWAWGLQAVVSAAVIAAVVWTFWRRRDPVLSMALFVTASFLVTPYIFNYDMIAFGWVLAQLRDHEGTRPLDDRLVVVVWTLPVTTMILGLAHIPISFLALAAFAARLIWRMARADAESIRVSALAQRPA